MKILGIETSCDETAAALLEVSSLKFKVLTNVVLSQVDIHKKYGGIVPEVAARKHVETIIPVIEEALSRKSRIAYPNSRLTNSDSRTANRDYKPDLIAVTQGPGLITSLQVGIQTAKTLSYVWQVPLVGVNHLEAHLWSHLLSSKNQVSSPPRSAEQGRGFKEAISNNFQFPSIGLIISGGHTEMVLVKGIGKYQLIGRTRDDAVGEAFDKVAKLLGLGYPGGPIISHFAEEGEPTKINFPRPMIDSKDFDFSFSGIKTAVKYYLKDLIPSGSLSQAMINDVCASFQQAIIEVLITKAIKAATKYKVKSIILGGGVSANEELIKWLETRCQELGINFCYPEKGFTQDNAAMVALTGFFNIKKASKYNWQILEARPNWLIG